MTHYRLTIDVSAVRYLGGGLESLPEPVRLSLLDRYATHVTAPVHPEGDPTDELLWQSGGDEWCCRPGDWVVSMHESGQIVCFDDEAFRENAVEVDDA